jgi:hypothetical protein
VGNGAMRRGLLTMPAKNYEEGELIYDEIAET